MSGLGLALEGTVFMANGLSARRALFFHVHGL